MPTSGRPEVVRVAAERGRQWAALEPPGDAAEHDVVVGLLATARRRLDADLCWLSRLSGDRQVIELCDGDADSFGVGPGSSISFANARYTWALHGRVPAVVGTGPGDELSADPSLSGWPGIGSYVGVPVAGSDGRVYGMLYCLSHDAHLMMQDREERFVTLLADVLSHSISDLRRDGEEREWLWQRISHLIDSGGPDMIFQPVFDLPSLTCKGAEALARFPPKFGGAQQCFADAAAVGLGTALELSAIRVALRALSHLPSEFGLGVNASPATVRSGRMEETIADVPADRLILEITEHDRIDDWPAMLAAIDILRDKGVRVAVDDVGAGYAGLQRLVQLLPDFIKMDQYLTRGIDTDPARRALATALVHFAEDTGGLVLAEGVETAAELGVVVGTGVHLAQGRYLAAPGPLPLPADAAQIPLDG